MYSCSALFAFHQFESTLHALVVAMSGKPQASFRLSATTFVKKLCISFEYVTSILGSWSIVQNLAYHHSEKLQQRPVSPINIVLLGALSLFIWFRLITSFFVKYKSYVQTGPNRRRLLIIDDRSFPHKHRRAFTWLLIFKIKFSS